jgi:Plastocyanin
MTNFKFNPSEIIINKGETITWINNDSAIHNVVGDAFKSGNIAKGQQFSYTFNETGTFSYVCTYHPGMTGKVTVK